MSEQYLKQQLQQERHRRKLAEDALLRTETALNDVLNSTRYRLGSKIAETADRVKPKKAAVPADPYDCGLPWATPDPDTLPKPQIIPIRTGALTMEDYPVLQVPTWDEPTVSIIIPCYNQFEYTYHCVESILRNSGKITYEILIADDCSTDLTTRVTDILPGVRHIPTETNLRFLLNCNNAARHARGRYVLFLNNDTQVQPDWLAPLVSMLNSDKSIGMVGAKLLYPDGRLQEAGGIIWRDGTAWNYGNKGNPAAPEFNYTKDVDYISGACIMLERSLWQQLGGFDEAFCPSYCEDSDLAFSVREAGYRVVYQPRSEVVHFEGVSNGTDTDSGLKQYQVKNREKLAKKWDHVLWLHAPGGTCVPLARERSFGKEQMLIIDNSDRYAADLFALGCNVKFMPMDGFDASNLREFGVELLTPDTILPWLEQAGRFLDMVYITADYAQWRDVVYQYAKVPIFVI